MQDEITLVEQLQTALGKPDIKVETEAGRVVYLRRMDYAVDRVEESARHAGELFWFGYRGSPLIPRTALVECHGATKMVCLIKENNHEE